MTSAAAIVAEAESVGIRLRLVDGKIKAAFPADLRLRLAPLLERLRANRNEVAELLKKRSDIPPMPPGVRLVAWEPKQPPVILTRLSVVIAVPLFIRSTLEQLEDALAGKQWLAGNWSVAELIDRLSQVGVVVLLEQH